MASDEAACIKAPPVDCLHYIPSPLVDLPQLLLEAALGRRVTLPLRISERSVPLFEMGGGCEVLASRELVGQRGGFVGCIAERKGSAIGGTLQVLARFPKQHIEELNRILSNNVPLIPSNPKPGKTEEGQMICSKIHQSLTVLTFYSKIAGKVCCRLHSDHSL